MKYTGDIGLPDLPKGYFFRIKKTSLQKHGLSLELRKRGLFGTSYRIDFWPIDTSGDAVATAKNIHLRAAHLVKTYIKKPAEYSDICGDYASWKPSIGK